MITGVPAHAVRLVSVARIDRYTLRGQLNQLEREVVVELAPGEQTTIRP